jgi:hypothetical protein
MDRVEGNLMALTSDNIKTIKQFADKLEKMPKNLPYSSLPTWNFSLEPTLFI